MSLHSSRHTAGTLYLSSTVRRVNNQQTRQVRRTSIIPAVVRPPGQHLFTVGDRRQTAPHLLHHGCVELVGRSALLGIISVASVSRRAPAASQRTTSVSVELVLSIPQLGYYTQHARAKPLINQVTSLLIAKDCIVAAAYRIRLKISSSTACCN